MKFENLTAIPDKYRDPQDIESGKVEKLFYKTRGVLGGDYYEKYCFVYLPYGYDPNKAYDIFYHVHGSGEVADRALYKGSEPTYKKYMFDNMIKDGLCKPFIWVSAEWYPENNNPTKGFHPEQFKEVNMPFHKELVNDILPAVESKYHTYADFDVSKEGLLKAKDHRAMGGWSQGSATTWFIFASEHGKYFGMYNPEAAPISFDRVYGMDMDAKQSVDMLVENLKKNGLGKDDFKLLFTFGDNEGLSEKMQQQADELMKHPDLFDFTGENPNAAYFVYPGGEHHTEWRRIYQFNALKTFFKEEKNNEI